MKLQVKLQIFVCTDWRKPSTQAVLLGLNQRCWQLHVDQSSPDQDQSRLWPFVPVWITACIPVINTQSWSEGGSQGSHLCGSVKNLHCVLQSLSSLWKGRHRNPSDQFNNQVWLVGDIPWWQLCCSRPGWQPARWADPACSAEPPHRAPGWTAVPLPSACWGWSCPGTDSWWT